ncbi:MAG: transglutaminase domain-containing protein [Planctomycetota bacterium]|nr:transglutaminase domain-containing protein [Planctomycetota bacterium]
MLLALLQAALLVTAAPPAPQSPPVRQQPVATQEDGWDALEAFAREGLGAEGIEAARFLRAHRPARDAALPAELLTENLRLALAARDRFPWAQGVTEELFLNDVLPYAVLDEKRESWRPMILELTAPVVAECKTAAEAVQAINRDLYDKIKVHYNTGRKRPNACASESIAQGRATCTGLTILFVEACRSVGIPARAAGVFLWHDDRGNHTWPEVWVDGRWQFTGADEFDPKGLNRGWFVADAARATAGDAKHGVWASSWATSETSFPLAWAPKNTAVAAVEVTARYVGDEEKVADALGQLAGGDEPLGEEASQRLLMEIWKERKEALAADLSAEAEARAFEAAGQTLRIKERVFGEAPKSGHSLWISMHGGGGAPAELNDGQWENQINLYEPAEGIYVAPRAPSDTWNLWHQGHIDPLFDRLIAAYVTLRGVDPDRVYLMGYSAGGDGVYQLAPRMADRFAAASMMAGHPNETKPDGLRNLPFALFMGGKDGAYDRNKIAARWKEALASLRDADPGGYDHEVTIFPEMGHWMQREDRVALPWMAARTRRAWPDRVVWLQDDVAHDRLYWLGAVEPDRNPRARVVASVEDQTIDITSGSVTRLTLYLHDRLIDLDKAISVRWNGEEVFSGEVPRTRAAIETSLSGRPDPSLGATALLVIERP